MTDRRCAQLMNHLSAARDGEASSGAESLPATAKLNGSSAADSEVDQLLLQPCPDNVRFSHLHTCITPAISVNADKPQTLTDLSHLGLLPPNTWAEYNHQISEFKRFTLSRHDSQLKSLLFVRHAEGHHNVAERKHGTKHWESHVALQDEYLDADLTDKGKQQIEALRQAVDSALAAGLKIDCVIVSPLSRAIDTALTGFASLVGKVPFICIESGRETLGRHLCDKRRSRTELQAKYGQWIDFRFLTSEHDTMFRSDHRETDKERIVRAASFLNFVFTALSADYQHIAVASHGGVLRACSQVLQTEYEPSLPVLTSIHNSNATSAHQKDSGEAIFDHLLARGCGYDLRNCELLPIVAVRTQMNPNHRS